MDHKKYIEGYTDNAELAEDLGNLRYDSLQEILTLLAGKLMKDGEKDGGRGRKKLSASLMESSAHIEYAAESVGKAWDISKPHMQK